MWGGGCENVFSLFYAVPVFSDINNLPEVNIAPEALQQWWETVSDVQQNRRQLITVVICALIIAIHSPECELNLALNLCLLMLQ